MTFESPLVALSFNFRFNQVFGIFPMEISQDFMSIRFRPIRLLWSFFVKFVFIAVITYLLSVWLGRRGDDFSHLWDKAFGFSEFFSPTDYFAVISHYIFLQSSATFIFFTNLGLGKDLTELNRVLKELTETIADGDADIKKHPPVFRMMVYRYSVCFMCTLASILYLMGVHSIIRYEDADFLDAAILVVTIVALYVENQNHMFSELLFLRFLNVLRHHCEYLLAHLKSDHSDNCCFNKMSSFILPRDEQPQLAARGSAKLAHSDHQHPYRDCCHKRCKILFEMYQAINKAFGSDLFVTIVILVISLSFGAYLTVTFLVFIRNYLRLLHFIVAYILYAVIPALRIYVLVEGSESVRVMMHQIKDALDDLEAELLSTSFKSPRMDGEVAQVRRVITLFTDKGGAGEGFTANGFFSLHRGILTSLVGSLVTYLIVLLQFKVTDLNEDVKQ